MKHRIDDKKTDDSQTKNQNEYINHRKLVEEKYVIIYHILYCRKMYLEKNKKTIFDKTIFEEFITECIGKMYDPFYEKKLKNKKKSVFMYNPENENERNTIRNRIQSMNFPNISGNTVINLNYLKIIPYINYNTESISVTKEE
jgi:hypothetical protein